MSDEVWLQILLKFYYICELCYNNTWQIILELNNVMTITVTILNAVW